MSIWGKKANGNISPARFVKQDTTVDNRVLQAGAGDIVYGISQHGTRNTPLAGYSDGYAAIAGEDLEIFGPHERTWLELAAACAAGQRLKSDTNGMGTPVTTDKDEYGAVAQVRGIAGQLIEVEVVPYQQVSV